MISLWRISFSCAAMAFANAMPAATVSGRVELPDSRDAAVVKSRDYSGVVVWLQPLLSPAVVSTSPEHARIVQQKKRFSPHVLAVPVGTRVDFPNFDPIFHNAFSSFNGQIFDLGLYPPGTSRSVKFDRAGIVRVFCNIHPMMSAEIVVVDTPYYAISGKDGAFQIGAVPPGEYELHVFHERAAQETLKKLERRLTVEDHAVRLPVLTISESGYFMAPHKNKYGRDYPPVTEDGVIYPGAKK